jgi:hypothetical protein
MKPPGANILKLLEISSHPFCESSPERDRLPKGPYMEGLFALIGMRNGFVALESTLRLFPLCRDPSGLYDMAFWNSDSAWRSSYGELADGLWFFAENAIGEQFAIDQQKGGIVVFDPEAGERRHLADDLEDWAGIVLKDWPELTMHPVVMKWQELNGPLHLSQSLVPKTMFIAGGKYEAENLFAVDAVEAMRFRGDIALQIKDLPDGAKIRIRIVDD